MEQTHKNLTNTRQRKSIYDTVTSNPSCLFSAFDLEKMLRGNRKRPVALPTVYRNLHLMKQEYGWSSININGMMYYSAEGIGPYLTRVNGKLVSTKEKVDGAQYLCVDVNVV